MSTTSSPRLRRRPSRTVPASVVSVVLLAVGVLAVVAAVARLSAGTWPSQVSSPASGVARLSWGNPWVITVAVVVAVLGLVLLVAGLKPGAHKSSIVQSAGAGVVPDREYVISTRAVCRLAAARAHEIDGVEKVSASATGRRVRLVATTTSEQRDTVRSRIVGAVSESLTAAGITPPPRVSAVVRTKEI